MAVKADYKTGLKVKIKSTAIPLGMENTGRPTSYYHTEGDYGKITDVHTDSDGKIEVEVTPGRWYWAYTDLTIQS